MLTVVSTQNVAASVATMTNIPRLELTAHLAGTARAGGIAPILATLLGVPLLSALVLGLLNLAVA